MKCLKCETEVLDTDNFCYNCGNFTSRGYTFFKENKENTKVLKEKNNLTFLLEAFIVFLIIFLILMFIKGKNMFSPLFYIEKQIYNYKYGYNISLIKTDNIYNKKEINDIDDAKNIIIDDLNQEWKCSNNYENLAITEEIKNDNQILSVNFCDISVDESKKIQKTINNFYNLFPSVKGYLTNITITNALEKGDYIAYFKPLYQFVNSNNDINKYNKVNKTQILLNSYYFLNTKKTTEVLNKDWYVKDATIESIVVHELGHYLQYVILLKEKNIDNMIFINKNNYDEFNDILKLINEDYVGNKIIDLSMKNYIKKYGNITLDNYALNISKYASNKVDNEIIKNEVVAEAIHDYYLHGYEASKESLEIINVIRGMI